MTNVTQPPVDTTAGDLTPVDPAYVATTEPPREAPEQHETLLGLDSYGWVGLAFLAFLLVLWKAGVFGAVTRALDSQADKVKADLAEAAALKAEAEAMKARAAREAAEAEATARDMLANAEQEATRILHQAEADADTAVARRQKLASDRISAEGRAAEAELRERAANITLNAARTILAERSANGQLAGLTDAAISNLDRR